MDPWSGPWNDEAQSTLDQSQSTPDTLQVSWSTNHVSSSLAASTSFSSTMVKSHQGIKRMPLALFAADAWGSVPPEEEEREEHKVKPQEQSGWESEAQGWGHNTVLNSGFNKSESAFDDHHTATTYASEPSQAWGDTVGTTPSALPDKPTEASQTKQEEDVWASEAAHRVEKAKQLSSDELDELKVAARRLMIDASATSASFRIETGGEEGWNGLYGEHGSKVDLFKEVSSSPPAIFKSDGSIITNLFEQSYNTAHQTREAIKKTEGKGSKLLAPESSSIWKRQSKIVTKPEWDSHGVLRPDVTGVLEPQLAARQSMEQESNPSAGPGWAQTTFKDTKSASGGSLFASLFKSKQASNSSPKPSSSGSVSPTTRNSVDRASMEQSQPPPIRATPPLPSSRDDATSIYTDDPTGPDLMNLGSEAQQHVTAPSSAQGGILSRWRKGNLFSSATSKRPAGLDENDIAWLDNHSSLTEAESSLDVEDSFDDFLSKSSRYHDGPPKHQDARGGSLIDFGAQKQTSYYDKPVPKVAQKAKEEDDWGSWEWEEPKPQPTWTVPSLPPKVNAGLSRTPSLQVQPPSSQSAGVKSPLYGGPLLPPPPSSNRFSLLPPPRVQSPTSPPDLPKSKLSTGTGLTASDLSFFDSL